MKFCFNLWRIDFLIEMILHLNTCNICNLISQMVIDDEKFMNKILQCDF